MFLLLLVWLRPDSVEVIRAVGNREDHRAVGNLVDHQVVGNLVDHRAVGNLEDQVLQPKLLKLLKSKVNGFIQ